jgi:hypothetical protein
LVQTRLRLRGTAGILVDPILREASSSSTTLQVTPDTTRVAWALTTRLHLGWEPVSRLRVFAEGGADFALNRFDYMVSTSASERSVERLAVAPRLVTGLAVNLP